MLQFLFIAFLLLLEGSEAPELCSPHIESFNLEFSASSESVFFAKCFDILAGVEVNRVRESSRTEKAMRSADILNTVGENVAPCKMAFSAKFNKIQNLEN